MAFMACRVLVVRVGLVLSVALSDCVLRVRVMLGVAFGARRVVRVEGAGCMLRGMMAHGGGGGLVGIVIMERHGPLARLWARRHRSNGQHRLARSSVPLPRSLARLPRVQHGALPRTRGHGLVVGERDLRERKVVELADGHAHGRAARLLGLGLGRHGAGRHGRRRRLPARQRHVLNHQLLTKNHIFFPPGRQQRGREKEKDEKKKKREKKKATKEKQRVKISIKVYGFLFFKKLPSHTFMQSRRLRLRSTMLILRATTVQKGSESG